MPWTLDYGSQLVLSLGTEPEAGGSIKPVGVTADLLVRKPMRFVEYLHCNCIS